MNTKDKIKQINAGRKPSQGLSESAMIDASKKAYETIMQNQRLAKMNISEIYSTVNYLTSTVNDKSSFYECSSNSADYLK